MGNVNHDCEGTWVVEDRLSKKPPILVATGLVTPHQGRVPMRVAKSLLPFTREQELPLQSQWIVTGKLSVHSLTTHSHSRVIIV